MIQRRLKEQLLADLQIFPAVALLGARQVGKTTLAKELTKEKESLYFDLELPEDFQKLKDNASQVFLQNNDKLIIIDEVQRMPNLFANLRGVIDQNRTLGKKVGQFVLLGSASRDLLRQSSESLAGRISSLEMNVFNLLEVKNSKAKNLINNLWGRGGFPDSYLAKNDESSFRWRTMFVRTYLERDIPQYGLNIPSIRLMRLWTMLAHLQGETINHSKLASSLEVNRKNIANYIDILIDLMLVRSLQPYYINIKKRLIKAPRIYVRDSGVVHSLLGINNYDNLLGNPILGKSWESFVIENVFSVLPFGVEKFYYRTVRGAEIDLVLQFPSSQIWAIEIKFGLAPKVKQGFHIACQDIGASKKFVIYSGEDEFPFQQKTTVISLEKFMQKLCQKI